MPKEINEVKVKQSDHILCSRCGKDVERIAPEGVELQETPVFVCDECQDELQIDSYKAELAEAEGEVPAGRKAFLKVRAKEARERIKARETEEAPGQEE